MAGTSWHRWRRPRCPPHAYVRFLTSRMGVCAVAHPRVMMGAGDWKSTLKERATGKAAAALSPLVLFFFPPLWSSQGTQISHSAPWEISSNARYMSVAGDVSTGAEAQRVHGPSSMPLARDKEQSSQFALTWREQKDASQKGSESEVGRLGTLGVTTAPGSWGAGARGRQLARASAASSDRSCSHRVTPSALG